MARVDVSMSSDLEPEAAWKLASDLRRFDEWMTIFGGWRGEVPATVDEGTQVSSCIKVKGFRNVIHWQVTRYHEPKCVELQGRGRGGVRIGVAMSIDGGADGNRGGSELHLTANLSGGVLSGPVGGLVARVLRGDVRQSVNNLAALR